MSGSRDALDMVWGTGFEVPGLGSESGMEVMVAEVVAQFRGQDGRILAWEAPRRRAQDVGWGKGALADIGVGLQGPLRAGFAWFRHGRACPPI